MIYIFLLIVSLIVLAQYRLERNIVNLISILIVPYIFNIVVNNFFVSRLLGFYSISDDVLQMLILAFLAFFLGSLPPSIVLRRNYIIELDNIKRFSHYYIDKMVMLVGAIAIIGLIKLAYIYLTGGFNSANFIDNEGVMGNGILGHLLLLSYSIIPIIFLYWTYNPKKISYLIVVVLIMLITFSTFVKNNIIALAVNIAIFLLIYRKSVFMKSIIFLCLFTILVFVANYAIGFYTRGITVNPMFYINHLWIYLAGSIIYDNYIFIDGIRTGINIFDKLMIFLSALPNMFFNKFWGFRIFEHISQTSRPIGDYGQCSNVVDAFGYLYPSGGNLTDVFVFSIVIVIIGFLFSYVYSYSKLNVRYFSTFSSIFLTYFVFFSFFGTFYINPGPWECLVYALVIPRLFVRRPRKL